MAAALPAHVLTREAAAAGILDRFFGSDSGPKVARQGEGAPKSIDDAAAVLFQDDTQCSARDTMIVQDSTGLRVPHYWWVLVKGRLERGTSDDIGTIAVSDQ